LKDRDTVAKPDLGAKRQCQSCATKFYDFNRDPIVCPKCGAVFHATSLTRAARAPDEEAESEKDEAETVSLTEVEEAENKVDAIAIDEDVEIDDGDEADDTFLEEEEGEEDDVSGLIDGDIDTDEEG
jgi:uncharacterized protein (TIGR02300 family)